GCGDGSAKAAAVGVVAIFPRAAADDPFGLRVIARPTAAIGGSAGVTVVPGVADEFVEVAVHVVQTPWVRLLRPDRRVVPRGIASVPGVDAEQRRLVAGVGVICGLIAEAIRGRAPRTAAILPLGFGGETNFFGSVDKLRRAHHFCDAGTKFVGVREREKLRRVPRAF